MKFLKLLGWSAGLVAVAGLAGCVTYATFDAADRLKAESHLLPVVRAIEQYRKDHGQPPATLEELQAGRKEPLEFQVIDKNGLQWSIGYTRTVTGYRADYQSAFGHLTYVDGKETDWSYNPWQ